MPKKQTWRDVLVVSTKKRHQGTLRAHYLAYRREQGMPEYRCDNRECPFYTEPLEWNGAPLPLILDHVEGNRFDNHPLSLRLLCPNCNSQQPTDGGKNRGRVLWIVEGPGYGLRKPDGGIIAAATGTMRRARSRPRRS